MLTIIHEQFWIVTAKTLKDLLQLENNERNVGNMSTLDSLCGDNFKFAVSEKGILPVVLELSNFHIDYRKSYII